MFANADTLFYYIRKQKAAGSAWGVMDSDSTERPEVSESSQRVHSAQSKVSAKKIAETGITLRQLKEPDQKDDGMLIDCPCFYLPACQSSSMPHCF